jgi:hypothetical protein
MSIKYINTKSETQFYKTSSIVSFWQGICPTNSDNEYLFVGTLTSDQWVIYKGGLNRIIDNNQIKTVIFPNSTGTSVYGP